MKKIVLIGFLFLSIASAMYGQKSKVNTAYNLVIISPPELDEAVKNIDAALQDPSTKDWVKTWYTAGFVYDKILEDQIRLSFSNTDDKVKRGESVIKAYDYYVKAYELDQLPDEKGKIKPKYDKSIATSMKIYPSELFNYGVMKFTDKDYAGAIKVWEKYLGMPEFPLMKDAGLEKDSMYIITTYYTATSAMMIDSTDISIKYFEKVKDQYAVNECYQFLAQQYLNEKKDTANYLKTIKTGFKKYPSNSYFLGSLIDYYIYMKGNVDSAFIYVNESIKINPQMADNYFIRGAIYEARNENESALADFKKTLELNPEHDRAMSSIGNYYFKRGDDLMRGADRMRDPKLEKETRDNAVKAYEEAIPYLEKAKKINPQNRANLITLRSIYYKLYKDEKNPKYVEVSKAIDALKEK